MYDTSCIGANTWREVNAVSGYAPTLDIGTENLFGITLVALDNGRLALFEKEDNVMGKGNALHIFDLQNEEWTRHSTLDDVCKSDDSWRSSSQQGCSEMTFDQCGMIGWHTIGEGCCQCGGGTWQQVRMFCRH